MAPLMHENTRMWDPYLRCYIYRSTWRNGHARIVPAYISKWKAWRPTQQRPRDGTVVRHKTGGLRKIA